jgi:hypothetical protein
MRSPWAAARSTSLGVAVTAATSPYPEVSCLTFCRANAGLVWLTRADARSVAPNATPVGYVLNLKLHDPTAAPTFADSHNPKPVSRGPGDPCAEQAVPPILLAWQDIRETSASLVENQRRALLTGGWLLGLLAVASITVLVGGRMVSQIRRVGLLKAVGGTPSFVAAVGGVRGRPARPAPARPDKRIEHWTEFDRGGHFAAMEAPDLLVGDMRTFFRSFR